MKLNHGYWDNTQRIAHIPYDHDPEWPEYEEPEAEDESIFDDKIYNKSAENNQPIPRRSSRLKRPNSRYMEYITDF